MKYDQLRFFEQINLRAGVPEQLVEILIAYYKYTEKFEEKVSFLSPRPSIVELRKDSNISSDQKLQLENFINKQNQNSIDDKLTNLLVSYAGIFIQRNIVVIFDRKHFANYLDYTFDALNFMGTDKYKNKYGYRTVSIPKRKGGYRKLSIPNENIKRIQRWILRNILTNIPKHFAAHGFRDSHSILTNAKLHVGKNIVINIDVKDFFPSIKFSEVLNLFLSIGYTYRVSVLLAQLCTFNERLPQGAPTSPEISNLICRNLDKRLFNLAEKMQYTYSRYADDLTFSSTSPRIKPKDLINQVNNILADEGFQVAREKTTVNRKGSRQLVTGIVVNRKINVKKSYRRKLRAIIHNSIQTGLDAQNRENCSYFYNQLRGRIAFIQGVNKLQGEKLLEKLNMVPRQKNESI